MRTDPELVQIVDARMAEAVRLGGAWIACRPGCFECCVGPFAVSEADAARLRLGLIELAAVDPERAARVTDRVGVAVERLRSAYPGATVRRVLDEDGAADEELCPVLDPESGTCDLYGARPMTCRTFGPAVRFAGGDLGACELCFVGATDEEIARCSVELDALNDDGAETLVAFALVP